MKYRFAIVIGLSVALLLGGQKPDLPLRQAEVVAEKISTSFNPNPKGPAFGSFADCPTTDQIELTPLQFIVLAYSKPTPELVESIGVIILKIHQCHVKNSDGMSYALHSGGLWSYIHPISRLSRWVTREIDNEVNTSVRAVEWAESYLKENRSQRMEEVLRETCKEAFDRELENWEQTCAQFQD